MQLFHQAARGGFVRKVHRKLCNAEVKLGRPKFLSLAAGWIGSKRRRSHALSSRVTMFESSVVENGVNRYVRSDPTTVVVATAISRVGWRRLRSQATSLRSPLVFYLRGQTMVDHLSCAAPPDQAIVNSDALVPAVQAHNIEPAVIYSIIDLADYDVSTSREVVLVVNPIPDYGSDLAVRIASALPEINFVFRESHTMGAPERMALQQALGPLENVRLLPPTNSIEEIYGRAKLLLVPYPDGPLRTNRPRVVMEAQRAGIPVIASAVPGLIAMLSEHGLIVDSDDAEVWAGQIRSLWNNDEAYAAYSQAARSASMDQALRPDALVDKFIAQIQPLMQP